MKPFANKNIFVSIFTRNNQHLAVCCSFFILLGFIVASTFVSKTIVNSVSAAKTSSQDVHISNSRLNNQHSALPGNILRVGPGQTYSRVRDAAAAALDGDTIEISAGTYSGDATVATFLANNLIVRGVGNGRAHLQANGANVQGKGIWVTVGSNLTIENIEFSDATVPDGNGAGIRAEGAGLTIRNCYFHHNENGILTSANNLSDILIENSEFYRNGRDGNGYIHNIYIGRIRSFTLRGSFTHGTRSGHNVKSRALKNILLYNRISDEADGTASYGVNLPEGGDCYLIGNVIQKGQSAENSSAVITFGEDNFNPSQIHQLTLVNNTLVNERGAANFVRFDKTPNSATLTNNIFVGGGTVSTFGGTVFRNNLVNQDPLFVNRNTYDYHLTANSPAINAGTSPGIVNGVNLTPTEQYVYPASTETRNISGSNFDIGAFERQSVNPTRSKAFDFDGDDKADISVFRSANAQWYIRGSQNGFISAQFGVASDKIVPADYDGDGKTDLAVYRNGTWLLQRSRDGFTSVQFGLTDDVPQPADFDGDGSAEIAVWRSSNGGWYIYSLANNQLLRAVQFGISGDKPMAADYSGDGRAEVAVWRPISGVWYTLNLTNNQFQAVQFGTSGDKPVSGDYDNDGKTDLAVYRSSNGTWYLQQSTNGFVSAQFGAFSDLPAPADYDGDGKTDLAVFRPANGVWYLQNSMIGFSNVQFGVSGDKPVPNAFVP